MGAMRAAVLLSLLPGLGLLGSAEAQSRAPEAPGTLGAPGEALPAVTLRALEGPSEAVTGGLASFELTRKLRWVYPETTRSHEEATTSADAVIAFDGTRHASLTATLRFDGTPQALAARVAPMERMAAELPELGRPPRVALTMKGMELKGVVESLALRCAGTRCEAQLTLLEAGDARPRAGASASADPTRSPDF